MEDNLAAKSELSELIGGVKGVPRDCLYAIELVRDVKILGFACI